MRRLVCVCALLVWAGAAQAGINGDLANFYAGLGAVTNVTPSGVYKTQAGGYYTGGGVYVRAPVRNYQLLQITPPTLRAGCGGIDLYLGGFSFINKQQFVQMLRNIGNNAAGYAFMLALQTISPQIYTTLQNLQDKIQKINQLNINSCEAAQALVNGVAGAIARNSTSACANWARAKGLASDEADAKQYCQNPANVDAMFSGGALTPAEKERKVVNKNLLWWGMGKDAYLSGDAELKGFLMALAGTLVVESVNGEPKLTWYPPLMNAKQFVDSVIYGGVAKKVKIYTCGTADPDCLHPKEKQVQVTRPLIKEVRKALDEIRTKLETEATGGPAAPLSAAAKRILVLTDVPVLRLMTSAVALGPTMAMQVQNMLAEPVAFSIAASYLDWAYRAAMRAVRNASEYYDQQLVQQVLDSFAKRAQELRELEGNHRVVTAMQLLKRAEWMDRVVISNLSPSFRAAFEGVGF